MSMPREAMQTKAAMHKVDLVLPKSNGEQQRAPSTPAQSQQTVSQWLHERSLVQRQTYQQQHASLF